MSFVPYFPFKSVWKLPWGWVGEFDLPSLRLQPQFDLFICLGGSENKKSLSQKMYMVLFTI